MPAVFCQDNVILPKHFPPQHRGKRRIQEERMRRTWPNSPWRMSNGTIFDESCRRSMGTGEEAAKILGIGKATLYRRLRESEHEQVS